jgi:N-acetylglucosamine kinase-like BadF-type ATPase
VSRPALIAVDGGGSKTDAVAIARDGTVLACARVPPTDVNGHHPQLLDAVADAVDALARAAGLDGDAPLAPLGVFCLAGADLPVDDRRILRWLERRGWARDLLLRNDTFAVLRAGTDRTWGVGVVCGFGTNCSAVAPSGRTYRFPALGEIAGDWGGGADLGEAALWYALRSEDGRGDRTVLATTVPAHFGLRRPRQVMEAMYLGRLSRARLSELSPLVFEGADSGDAVATSIADRQADEVVTMAGAAMRRLRMTHLDVHVVLGGGIFRNRFGPFYERIELGLEAVAPKASMTVLSAPPVVGAALLWLDAIGGSQAAKARVRGRLTDALLAGHR